jgi:hypothetical protein
MKKHQILRLNNGKQQHYDVLQKKFVTSETSSDGEFEMEELDAQQLFAVVRNYSLSTNTCKLPQLITKD